MRALAAALAIVAVSIPTASQKKPKPPDVQVIEARAHRGDGKILMDGRIRVTAEKPLRGLVLVFDLISPENGVVATKTDRLEEELLEPGEERAYHSETTEQPRAVRYQVRAFDRAERDLRLANAGPFPIE